MSQLMEHVNEVNSDSDFPVLIDTARRFAAVAREHANETERNRHVAPEIMALAWENNLLAAVKPRAWGGHGCTTGQFAQIVCEIAKGDASTAWSYSVLAGHAANITGFPDEAQRDVWAKNERALVSSAFAPTGKAIPVSGGFRLSGRYPFSSGCDHADWFIVGAMAQGPDGHVVPHNFLLPKADITIHDDWFTMGLCGTGSKTLETVEAFVPAHRVIVMPTWLGSLAPFGLQAAMIGSAWGGLEFFIQETRAKPAKWNAVAPAQSEHVQIAVGESWADLTAAWTMLCDAMTRCGDPLATDVVVYDLERQRGNRAANSVISRLCNAAVERVVALSGGNGVYDTPLSRAVRDVRAASQHMATNTNVAAKDVGVSLLA